MRDDVPVTIHGTIHFDGDRMGGLFSAVYDMPDGQTTVPLRMEGIRSR